MKAAKTKHPKSYSLTDLAWDLFCCCSVVGIWPRFIEPKILDKTQLYFPFPELKGKQIKVFQVSDLHLNERSSSRFLKKIIHTKELFSPDITVFTGDFFCRSNYVRQDELKYFLSNTQGKYGSFCCLGNHDYTPYVTLSNGEIIAKKRKTAPLIMGFKKLLKGEKSFENPRLEPGLEPKAAEEILALATESGFEVLQNTSRLLEIQGAKLRIAGLGDYWSGTFLPSRELFKQKDDEICITLSHNPDSFTALRHYPIDLILSGHTHGRQVNLPFIGKRLTPALNQKWARGLYSEGNQKLYVNRGLGGQTPFRWFSKPECTLITLGDR